MAVLTEAQIKNVIRTQLVAISGYPDDHVRTAYQGEQPAYEQTDDRIFIFIQAVDSPQSVQVETTHPTEGTPVQGENGVPLNAERFYTRVMQAQIMCYGPKSYDTAEALWFGLMENTSTKQAFDAVDIKLINRLEVPKKAPYNMNGKWWQRADLTALFNVGTLRTSVEYSLASASIEIHTADGAETVEVTPDV